MKEIKAPLETRYKSLKITATCNNSTCKAGFELEGKDIHIYREGNPQSYCGNSALSFLCPHCGKLTTVQLEDKELEAYIMTVFDPVYYE